MLNSSCTLQANKPEYYKINGDKFLGQELAGKAVIEFPVLIVLLPGQDSQYTLAADVPENAAQAAQWTAEQPDGNAVPMKGPLPSA